MNYQKKYWSENEFTTKLGDYYSGYVGILNGDAYIFDTGELLIKTKNYKTQFNVSEMFFDRILDEEISLPYSKKEVTFHANDFLYKGSIKNILQKLQANNDFIYKCSTISDTLIPAVNDCFILNSNGEEKRGVLSLGSLSTNKKTKTALDPTFYPQVVVNENGETSISEPLFNFNEITATDMVITELIDGKATIFIFIAFKNKFMVLKYHFYPNDYQKNTSLGDLDFNNFEENLWQDDDRENAILYLEQVDPSKDNSIKFLNINDIRIRGNYLYLVDKDLNMVLRYDIQYLLKNNLNIKYIKLVDMLQGEGSEKDNVYFKKPCSVCADDDYIYVADQSNNCIKKYSESFDYISTIRNGNFADQTIQTISINPYEFTLDDGTVLKPNSLWVFSVGASDMFVHIIDSDSMVYSKRIEKIRLLKDEFMWDEQFKSVKFSFTNSNYYYITTSKRIYKLHLSKPFYPFASLSYFKQRILLSTMVWSRVPYPWHILPTGEEDDEMNVTWGYRPSQTSAEVLDNKGFCLCGYSSDDGNQFNGDLIFHIGTMYDQQKVDHYCKTHACKFNDIPSQDLADMIKCSGIFLYNETDSWLSTLTSLDFKSYISEEIENINSQEYVNALTFNKAVYKVVYNLNNIKNNLIGRFWGAYNLDNIMCFDQLEYDDFFQELRIEKIHDLFVHDNEAVNILINRIFEKIYDLQVKILDRMKARYRSISSFTNNSFRII